MNVEAHIRARLANPVDVWEPKEGECLIGMVVGRYTFVHDQYGESPVVKLLVGDREWRWHAMGTVAQTEVEQCDPQFGDWLGVKYEGQPGEYKKWRVVHVPAAYAGEVGKPDVPAAVEPERAVPPTPAPSPVQGPSAPKSATELEPGEEPFEIELISDGQRADLQMLFSKIPEEKRKQVRAQFGIKFHTETTKDLRASQFVAARAWLQAELATATGENVEHS